MKLSLKICMTMLVMLMVVTMVRTTVFAVDAKALVDAVDEGQAEAAKLETDTLTAKAGKVLGLIRTAAFILGTVIIGFLGLKYMMGSVEEKSKYKESMMPLVVGTIVVVCATAIASLLFSL